MITARYTAKSLGLMDASSLAVGPDGDLNVTDISERVTVISPAGKVLRRWGGRGRGPGEFRLTYTDRSDIHAKIAVGTGGLVYVSDSGNARIQVFTAHGRYLRQFGSFVSGEEQFLAPFDIAVDDAGNVYVVDDQLRTPRKFTPTGTFVWQVGGSGSPEPDLIGHLRLNAIDAHGRLVVVNDDNGRLVYLDRDGREVEAFKSGGCDATVDSFGFIYADDCGVGTVAVFDRTHQLVARWPATHDPLRTPQVRPVLRSVHAGPGRIRPPASHHAVAAMTSC